MRRPLLFVAAIFSIVSMIAANGAAGVVQERRYVAGPGDATTANCSGQTAADAPAFGGGCFDVPAGATYAKISIADATGNAVAGQYYFRDAAGATVAGTPGVFCGDRTVPVAAGSTRLTVYVSTAYAALDCALTASPATTGTMRVEWTNTPQTAGPVSAAGRGSANVTPVANITYPAIAGWPWAGGTDLEFTQIGGRKLAVTGSYQNGMRIIDITNPAAPALVSTYDCKIYQADVQIFGRDGRTYVAYAVDDYSRTNVQSACFRDIGHTFGDVAHGSFIIDITDPAAPKAISFAPLAEGSHNATIDPSGRYLYNSNADLPGSGVIEIFDLADLTNPVKIKVLDMGTTLPSHDITFSEDGTRAYVAALTSTQILDTTDPANPSIVGTIIDPTVNIHHQADPITIEDPVLGERTYIVVTDEIGGAEGNGACPGGGLHVYDATGDLEANPVPVGFFDLPDTRVVNQRLRCTAHVMRIYPDQKIATIAWYAAGVRVLDLSGLAGLSVGTEATGSVGAGIKQIGWYAFDKTDTWAVKAPADGFEADGSFHMFGSDQLRGFDVYRFDASAPVAADAGRWMAQAPALPWAGVRDASAYRLACVVRPVA